MKTTYNGVEFTEIEYIFPGETETQDGLLIHDLNDEFHDGDMIVGHGCTLPESAEDAAMILESETGSCFHVENGVYIIE